MTISPEIRVGGEDENDGAYMSSHDRVTVSSPEISDAEENIEAALQLLSDQLLNMGIISVGVKSAAGRLGASAELEIDIQGSIRSIDLIGLTFYYSSGAEKTIQISGSNIEDGHLSGEASAQEYARRIMEALNKQD